MIPGNNIQSGSGTPRGKLEPLNPEPKTEWLAVLPIGFVHGLSVGGIG
jgi:hypothetical protein